MMTTLEWNELLDPKVPLGRAKRKVMAEARLHLSTLAPGLTISTNELGDALYPRSEGEKCVKNEEARKRLFDILYKLAVSGMEDCCVKGEVNGQYMGKPKRPWLWFCPDEMCICPQCGQLLPDAEV